MAFRNKLTGTLPAGGRTDREGGERARERARERSERQKREKKEREREIARERETKREERAPLSVAQSLECSDMITGLGNMRLLTRIDLADNRFSGAIPANMANLPLLEVRERGGERNVEVKSIERH